MLAAHNGDMSGVELLLTRGGEVNARNKVNNPGYRFRIQILSIDTQ